VAAAINDERKKGNWKADYHRLTWGNFSSQVPGSVFRGFIQTFILLVILCVFHISRRFLR